MDLNSLLKSQWDRVGAVALSVIGLVFLLVGWIGVSGTAYLAEQAPYILSGGVGGVFLLGIGATLWISADLRDEWRKLDRIEAALGNGTLRWAEEPALEGTSGGPAGGTIVSDQVFSDPKPRAASNGRATTKAAAVAATAPARRASSTRTRTARVNSAES
jgi:hypothetical protein